MRKLIFIIAVCMLYHNAYGAGEICSNPCLEGTFPVPYDREACEVCPANTYTDERLCHSGMSPTCKPCPAGTGTIGDTAADHDSIDDCIPMETARLAIRRPIMTVLMTVFRWKQKKYLVIRDITYPQTANLAHNVPKIHIVLVEHLPRQPQILG